jgi:hypothetical protein
VLAPANRCLPKPDSLISLAAVAMYDPRRGEQLLEEASAIAHDIGDDRALLWVA